VTATQLLQLLLLSSRLILLPVPPGNLHWKKQSHGGGDSKTEQ